MELEYLIKFMLGSTARLKYDEAGFLQTVTVNIKNSLRNNASNRKFWEWLPTDLIELSELQQHSKYGNAFTIEKIQMDLSFGAFWTAFGNKVGKKARAERLWEAMNDIEKATALGAVQNYKKYLAAKPHIEQAYPETWLAGRRWENEYKGT